MSDKNTENQQNNRFNFILDRLNQYEDYFHVLGLTYDESKKEYYTSEVEEEKINQQVQKLYNSKIEGIKNLLKGCEKFSEYENIKENFEEKVYDAYNALKDRNSRIHYIQLLDEIKKVKKGEDEWEK